MSDTTAITPADPVAVNGTHPDTKRTRRKAGEPSATKPGFGMKQLSTCVNKEVKDVSQQLEVKEHLIFTAGVLLFNRLSIDDQFTMLNEARKLHAAKVKEEQAAIAPATA